MMMVKWNIIFKILWKNVFYLYFNCVNRTRKTQSKLLAGAIVTKRMLDGSTNPSKKQKLTNDEPKQSTGLIIISVVFLTII